MREVLYNEKAENNAQVRKMRKTIIEIICICLMACMLMGCSANNKSGENVLQTGENSDTVTPEVPATEDVGVVLSVDVENKIINLQSVTTGEKLFLNYTGGCDVRDKYNEILSITQVEPGEIVDFSYVASKKKMYSLTISNTAWEYKEVKNLKVNEPENIMSIADVKYKYSDMLVILSEGESAMLMDINSEDTLILRGIGKQVCSIVIDKGHGYVKLVNSDYFVGGWVEVGQAAVKPVTKDMMLVVPEGNYTLSISKDGVGGSKSITVTRNEEITVDVGDLKGEELPLGSVKFNITPKEAVLTIDGKEMAHNEIITLKYGSHKLKITADGYETYSGTLKVKETLKELDIALTKESGSTTVTPTASAAVTQAAQITGEAAVTPTEGAAVTPASGTSPSITPVVSIISGGEDGADTTHSDEASGDEEDSTSQSTSTGSSKIYITAPTGAEVYLDGTYMGLVPIDFAKTSGTHTITLRKEGYKTKSYTVYISDDSADATYSFSDMVESDD